MPPSALGGGGLVTSERWVLCSSVRANGSVGALTTVLPPSDGASALFTSGDVANAPGPNDETGAGTDNRTEARGANDVSILRLDIQVPPSANCRCEPFHEWLTSAMQYCVSWYRATGLPALSGFIAPGGATRTPPCESCEK